MVVIASWSPIATHLKTSPLWGTNNGKANHQSVLIINFIIENTLV